MLLMSNNKSNNSPLVSYTQLSPNHSGIRTQPVDRITPHCIVGQLSVETLGSIFVQKARKASCNYGIGEDGRVGLYVDEANRSWCSSNPDNDQRAVTIECASDRQEPYAFKDVVYNKLIDLCVDICKRHGKKKLLWLENKDRTLRYKTDPDEMLLTVHRWFAKKSCPGDWMFARMGDLAEEVTARLDDSGLDGKSSNSNSNNSNSSTVFYRVRKSWDKPNSQIAAFTKLENAKNCVLLNPAYSVFDDEGNKIYSVE